MTREQRIQSYSTLAAAFLGVVGTSDAAILYTDVDPDAVSSDTTLAVFIDIDQDGTNDFRINHFSTFTVGQPKLMQRLFGQVCFQADSLAPIPGPSTHRIGPRRYRGGR